MTLLINTIEKDLSLEWVIQIGMLCVQFSEVPEQVPQHSNVGKMANLRNSMQNGCLYLVYKVQISKLVEYGSKSLPMYGIRKSIVLTIAF